MSDRYSIKRILLFIAGLILGLVFLWSGISKLLHPEDFALAVYRYHLLPSPWVNLVALWIPVLEILCGVLVFVPGFRCAAVRMLIVLLVLFSIAIAYSIWNGNTMACGCFSTSVHTGSMSWSGLLKNIGLMVLAFVFDRNR